MANEDTLLFSSNEWKGYVAGPEWGELFRHLNKWLAHNPGETIVHYDCRDVRKITTPLGVVYLKDIRALTDAGMHGRDIFSWLKWVFRRSRAIETWNASQQLRKKGFLCPKPLLAVRRRNGLIPQDIFVSAEVAIPSLWDSTPKGMDPKRIAEMLADEIRRLHRAGFAHGDCILRNLCYDEKRHRLAYLDNDRTWEPPAALRASQQQRNLSQMAYSLLKRFGEAASMHFLEMYARKAGWPSRTEIRSIQAAAIKRRNRKHSLN